MRSKQANQPHQFSFQVNQPHHFVKSKKSSKQNESHQFVDRTTAVKATMPLIYIYIYIYIYYIYLIGESTNK